MKHFKDFHYIIKKRVQECVERQGNDYHKFLKLDECTADRIGGGFTWSDTSEGYDFWDEVLQQGNEKFFFTEKEMPWYEIGDSVRSTEFDYGDAVIVRFDNTESLSYLIYSQKADELEKGHDGNAGNDSHGHFWVSYKSLQHVIPNKASDVTEILKFKIGDLVYFEDFNYPDTKIVYITENPVTYLLFSQTACNLRVGHGGSSAPREFRQGDYGHRWVEGDDLGSLQFRNGLIESIKVGDLVEVVNVLHWGSRLKLGQRFVVDNFKGSSMETESSKGIAAFNRGEDTILINNNKYSVNFKRCMLKIINSSNKQVEHDISSTIESKQGHPGSSGFGLCKRRSTITIAVGHLGYEAGNYRSKSRIEKSDVRPSV